MSKLTLRHLGAVFDTDYSVATSEMARAQIIQQAGTAMLAQANVTGYRFGASTIK